MILVILKPPKAFNPAVYSFVHAAPAQHNPSRKAKLQIFDQTWSRACERGSRPCTFDDSGLSALLNSTVPHTDASGTTGYDSALCCENDIHTNKDAGPHVSLKHVKQPPPAAKCSLFMSRTLQSTSHVPEQREPLGKGVQAWSQHVVTDTNLILVNSTNVAHMKFTDTWATLVLTSTRAP